MTGSRSLRSNSAAFEPVQREDAGDLAAHAEGHHDARLGHVLPGAGDVHAARVAGHVVHELRLVVTHHPAGQPLVDGEPELLVELGVDVARVDAHQLARLLVEHADVHGVVDDDVLEHGGDAREHLALVERAEQQGAQVHELVLQGQLALELRRRRLELVVLPGVADGDRGEVGEQARGLELALRERAPAEPVHGHHAEDLVADGERHEDAGLHLVLFGAGDVDGAPVLRHVVDQLGLVVVHDPAADALVQGDGEVEDLLLVVLVARVDGDELAALRVDEADVHGVVVDDLLERVGDVLEHLGLLERREHGAAGAEQLVAQRQLLLELPRRLLGLAVLARVVDGDGGEVGEQRDGLELVLVESALAHAVEREHADHLVAQRERRDDARLGLPLGTRHQRAARVVQHVVDQLRLVVLHDPAAHADVDRAAPRAHLLDCPRRSEL